MLWVVCCKHKNTSTFFDHQIEIEINLYLTRVTKGERTPVDALN